MLWMINTLQIVSYLRIWFLPRSFAKESLMQNAG